MTTTTTSRAAFRLRLGTRRSALALAQSGMIARALEAAHPGLAVELVPMVTTGDVVTGDLAQVGGKGLFTMELEKGLLDGSLDLAVHSMKDLPVALPDGLVVAAHPERADPRDVLVSEQAADLDGLPEGAVVLTGALRRRAQILLQRPGLQVEPIRGNVDTRLRKWKERNAGGVILAAAGLQRLSLDGLPAHPIATDVLLPAPCQGTLALEVRAGGSAEELCRVLDHHPTRLAAEAERRVVAAFGGDCTLPLAAWARSEGDVLRLTALLATPDGRLAARGEAVGATPAEVAEACVERLRENGADEVLERLR
ncbi:MAG TPA: hydroxymethylbilane synthase [Thermoanaerobaculia bacterium]|nr:hydroxymethylbilane synthase [Thermoanaerobaculia bacterium]